MELVQGDDIVLSVQLKKNNATFAINPAATVRASVVNTRTDAFTAPVTLADTDPGASWSTSLVTVQIPSATSATMALGQSKLEIEVDDGGKTTFFVSDLRVVEGFIT